MRNEIKRNILINHSTSFFFNRLKEVIIREDPFGHKRCLKDVSKDESNLYTKHFGAVYSATVSYTNCNNSGMSSFVANSVIWIKKGYANNIKCSLSALQHEMICSSKIGE